MKLAIMQPYFLPYIGYFQLIAAVDRFVVYDNIKYTKKGWINRNRMLVGGSDAVFSLPLKKASDSLDVRDRKLSETFDPAALLNQFKGAYEKAPFFADVSPLLEKIVKHPDVNLFGYLHHAITEVCRHLGIATEVRVSSSIAIDHGLKGQDKVLALCESQGADVYVNTGGGQALYERQAFAQRGIELQFIKPRPVNYRQFDDAFVPWLSIIDVLMFNPLETVQSFVNQQYELS